MRRLCRRDPSAMAEIYDRYAPLVYSVLIHITCDVSLSGDLLQELFLKVWNRAAHFDAAQGRLDVWLLSSARDLALSYRRSPDGRIAKRLLPAGEAKLPGNAHSESDCFRSRQVSSTLAQLSYCEREVLELAYFGGYTQTEIASLLAKPLGKVKSWMRTGLARLRSKERRRLQN